MARTDYDRLTDAGWTRVSYKKMGMVRMAMWHDSKTGSVVRQGFAIAMQRDRNRARKVLAGRSNLEAVRDES